VTVDIEQLKAEIEVAAQQHLVGRHEATIEVGLWVGGERWIKGFRSADAEAAALPAPDTVYEIGSVSKTFSNTVLAVLEDRGMLGLDDPIAKRLPSELRLSADVAAITLRQLATHSSGLTSLGKRHAELIASELRGTLPPFGTYTHYLRYRKEHLYADLEDAELAYPTGKGWEYCVMGMGLLGHILELVAGKPYEELLKETVCEPLGLSDTGYTLSPDQLARLMPGYDAEGQPLPSWYHDVLMSQGGLRSTMNDLLTYAEAHLGADGDSVLGRAMRRTREVHYEGSDGHTNADGTVNDFVHGLAWRGLPRPDGRRAWHHPGATMWYLTSLGVDDHARVACAVLSSDRRSLGDLPPLGEGGASALGKDWFNRACS
jgi:CubicO group peptidase (beta-lactamase class C family)